MKTRTKDTLLLIGDTAGDRAVLRSIFESKFYLLEASSVPQGLLLLNQNRAYITAVVTDVPLSKGAQLQELIAACQHSDTNCIPVLGVIQPQNAGENEERAYILGFSAVVQKPYTPIAIQRRIQILVDLYLHQWNLEQMVEKQNHTIRHNNQIMVDTLSSIIEYRSTEAGDHVLRIRRFTKVLLESLARNYPEYGLTENTIDIITSAASMHDIGKIGIPDSILNKPGKLTTEEFEIMKTHTTIGSQIVHGLQQMEDAEYLRYVYNITRYHHERWDGKGYPEGLVGDQIPICAQAVGLTDVFDALTSARSYKPAYSYDTAINMILNGACGVFSPKLLECFKRVRSQLIEIAESYASGASPLSDDIRLPLPGPAPVSYAMDAMQLSQMKYHALLHHLNSTVIEMDLNARLYHVVYNPNPDFVTIFSETSFDELSDRIIRNAMHPDDAPRASQQYGEGMTRLFRQGGRKYTFHCRMYSPPHEQYYPYEITLQRINTDQSDQRMVLVIFSNQQRQLPVAAKRPTSLPDSPVMYDLTGATVCCTADDLLTILDGAPTLTRLTGFHPDEIWDKFSSSLLALAFPEDRKLLEEKLQQQSTASRTEFDFRLQRKNQDPIWVLCKLRMQTDSDGTGLFYMSLTDITRLKLDQQRLETTLARNEVLLNQSSSVVFEWDLINDYLRLSDTWYQRFGYSIPPTNFSKNLVNDTTPIHPDDLPGLIGKIQAMRGGSPSEFIDVRIINDQGKYFWSRIRGNSVCDAQGRATHIVGIIHDIDQLKTEAISSTQRAQRDDLTKLLNKVSTQRQIADYLSIRSPDSMAAMLVLDLDNFKLVNDTLGHFYGDALLKQIGTTLRSLFRSDDVVGRIGGDEFMILLKEVPNRDIITDRCSLLVETFRNQFQTLLPQLSVSVSVGAAVIPDHGTQYADLYRRADEALYNAKRMGKNQFNVYSPADAMLPVPESGTLVTRIDSDDRPTIDDTALPYHIFQTLYESQNLEATINEMLAFIGVRFNVSRVYIFENTPDNRGCSNTFEWCNVGITPQIHNLQYMSYETDIPNWPRNYDETGILYCSDVTEMSPEVRAVVEPQGIKSMLHCAIRNKGVFQGFVGFDECSANHLWTQDQVTYLKRISSVLAVFVTRLRNEQKTYPVN